MKQYETMYIIKSSLEEAARQELIAEMHGIITNFGGSIDDVNGRIRLDSLTLNTSGERAYFLDNLTITAGQVGGEKEIQVLSPFMTAVVRGDYTYQTIPDKGKYDYDYIDHAMSFLKENGICSLPSRP